MFHGSSHFGRAYQEELHRIAGVSDEQESEGVQVSRDRGPGILSLILGRLFSRRREAKRTAPASMREQHSTFGG
jgi:hypothetical protein